MGYLSPSKDDVFVSYPRVLNETGDEWITAFRERLKARLKAYVGDVEIWRDEDYIRGGEEFHAKIEEGLKGAAIFLAIISRTYLLSNECRSELDQFLGLLKDSNGGCNRKIFPILKHPLRPEEKLPNEIAAIQHDHHFFVLQGPRFFREFSANDAEFVQVLARVAQDIAFALEEFKKGTIPRPRVFIARVSPELREEREKLRCDLQQRGYHVVPEREYLWNSDSHRTTMMEDLDGALLSIHLVAGSASIEPAAVPRARLQLELAQEAMKRKARPAPMVWIRPTGEIDTSARELLDYIKRDLADAGVEYSEGGLEEFKTQLYDKLPSLGSSCPAPPAHQVAPVRQIALLVEERDVGELGPIKAFLVDRLALDPMAIKFVGALPKDQARLARTLAACEQCLIFWAGQPEEWVLDLLDHEALGRHLGRERTCVYAVGPETPEKCSFQTMKARTILAADGLNEPELQAFCGGGRPSGT